MPANMQAGCESARVAPPVQAAKASAAAGSDRASLTTTQQVVGTTPPRVGNAATGDASDRMVSGGEAPGQAFVDNLMANRAETDTGRCHDPGSCFNDFVGGVGEGVVNWPGNQIRGFQCMLDVKCAQRMYGDPLKDPLGSAVNVNPFLSPLRDDVTTAQNMSNGNFYAAGQTIGDRTVSAAVMLIGAKVAGLGGGRAAASAGDSAGVGGGPSPYYHYTSAENAAGIQASGQIIPGANGNVYVSPTAYGDAATAQSELALPNRPAGYSEIPASRISGLNEPSTVQPKFGWPGGGLECWTTCPIDVTGLPLRKW